MDGENRGEHDRAAVVRALRSLNPLTAPTASERLRIRDRVLLALDADDSEEPNRGPASPTDSPNATPPSADASRLAVTLPRPRDRTKPRAIPDQVPARDTEQAEPTDSVTGQRATASIPATADTSHTPTTSPRRRIRAVRTPSRPGVGHGSTRPGDSAAKRAEDKPAADKGPEDERAEDERRPDGEGSDDKPRGVWAGARGRLVVAAFAVFALVGSLAGMSVLLSRDALPGDALYGVKRTAEAASLGLTFGDEPKALKHLEFASARISEIETLARRYPNPADAPVGGYLTALTDFDNDAIAGSRQLFTLAKNTDGRLLESLRDWSAQQASRLRQVAAHLPQAARNRQNASRALLDRVTARATDLLARTKCYQKTSGSFDDIGALPATGPCEEKTTAPTSSGAPPIVAQDPDSSAAATGAETPSAPIPSAQPTPAVPPVPVPGTTVSVPAPTDRPSVPSVPSTTTVPPLISLPPLLPGLGLG
ncbi:DUF5667 domain-containing protein [Actinophytocola sp.]|uniref:DUF5667 domain-containing protein n=1 Tax=Actinophytocola sp. TaxID=1872138 RepID=UPI00389A6542